MDKLIRFGSVWLSGEYILADGWISTPNQRTELEAYRDVNVYLHRVTSPNHKTSMTLNFCPMPAADKARVQSIINGAIINEDERKVFVTYWNEETNEYSDGFFYISDITFQTLGFFGGERWYRSFTAQLTEY